jgi:hypothetical protein
MYEKFAILLRLEIGVHRLKDLGLHQGLENLHAWRQNRLTSLEAELLNVHVDFPRFQRLAQPIPSGPQPNPGH